MKHTLLLFITLIFTCTTIKAQTTFTKSTIDANTSARPYAVAASDLTNDGNLDLAIGTYNGSKVTWYKNNGDATFAAGVTLTVTGTAALSYIESIAIADLNKDGHNDIIATGSYNDRLVWFENNGDETFQPAALIANGIAGAGAVKVANIDNDPNGNLDIIVTAYTSNSVVYFLGNGDGTFDAMRTLAQEAAGAGPGSFDIADFDGDGDLDVVVGYTGNGEVKLYDNKFIQDGLDGTGNVPFVAYTNNVDSGNGYLWSVIFGDINNDGNLEIIRSDNNPGTNPNIAWFINDTSGTDTSFTKTTIPTSIKRSAAIAVADINYDGTNDLIVGNGRATDFDLIWFEGNGSGSFGSEIVMDDSTSSIFSMAVADFNNDGGLDIAAISHLQNDLVLFINDMNTISIEDFKENALSIYPNPTSNKIQFKGLNSESETVSVFDVLGKQVLSQTLLPSEGLDVSILQKGMYILKLENSNTSFKFLKE
ncbi:MAG TPA: T9SS type A sorting domain-containing protein [Xanthomarina sp.]|nr:T9SS type A sorting domain-containing protein [Xanthomarina sp.]